MVHIERTPLASVARMAVYENTRELSLSQIVAEEKPDIAFTAVFYNPGTWKPLCPVKKDGKVLYADTQYNYHALSWNEGADAAPELILPGGASAKDNYVANCILITGGTPHQTLYYGKDAGGTRGRIGVGLLPDNELLIYGSTDGSRDAMTPEELRDYLAYTQGCYFAIMMDGGRKVNLYVRHAGVMMEGKDPSQTLILLYLNKKDGESLSVKTYSLKSSGSTYLSKNFRVREFACNDGSDTILISEELVTLLQKIRDHFRKAAVINSAYRTATYNKKVGGATNSQHIMGTAADIVVAGVDPMEVAEYVEYIMPDSGGIGVYQTFTHVDVRTTRSRWDQRSGKQVVVSGWLGYAEPTEADIAVSWVQAKGIMLGNENGDLMLDQSLTRKQFAVMLYRYHQINGQK